MKIFESYDLEKIEQKSKEFLKKIMGEEKFNKLKKDGKIEIEYGADDKKTIYELHSNGQIINKTKNQSYCIVTDRSDYPIDDLIAIKYAWLVYNNKRAEKVANKTDLGSIHSTSAGYTTFIRDMERRGWNRQQVNIVPGYAEYVDYLSNIGWFREQITLDEHNTNMVSRYDIQEDSSAKIIDVRCPAGVKISIMGTRQIPLGVNPSVAYPLSLNVVDDNGEEIPPFTKIRITKVKPTEEVIQLARIFYSDIGDLIQNGDSCTRENAIREAIASSNPKTITCRKKRYEELYRFCNGIEINGEEHLEIHIVDSDRHISANNINFHIDLDLWVRS